MQAGRGTVAHVAAAFQRAARQAVGGSEQISRRTMLRPLAKRRLRRLVVVRVLAIGRVNRPVDESAVHFVIVVMVVSVVMIGRHADRVAVLVRHWFAIPNGTIMLY